MSLTIAVCVMSVITFVMMFVARDAHRRYVDEHKRAEALAARMRYHAREAAEERNRTTLFLEERRALREEVDHLYRVTRVTERDLKIAWLDGRELLARELIRSRYLDQEDKEFLVTLADNCQVERFMVRLNLVMREHA